jgi:predicted NUDIX family NTP pyrophosphohydrolase
VKKSAGILLFRYRGGELEVLLAHPGGPFWVRKDDGAWSILKGEFDDNEAPLTAAKREFEEETGLSIDGSFLTLTPRKQNSGKTVHAFALEGDCDTAAIRSNTFSTEWPRGSGQMEEFPEIDRAEWFSLDRARIKILPGQRGFVDELETRLKKRC